MVKFAEFGVTWTQFHILSAVGSLYDLGLLITSPASLVFLICRVGINPRGLLQYIIIILTITIGCIV